MRLRVARITNSYVPYSIGLFGLVVTSLGVLVGESIAKNGAALWQRWALASFIAVVGVTLSTLLARFTSLLIERFIKAEERSRFLAAFSEFLSRSFTFEDGVAPLASLVVPLLGDECLIDILERGDRVRRTTSSGQSSEYGMSRFEILNQHPALFDDGSGIIVPMKARDQVFGTLTLMWTVSRRQYSAEDLAFACDVARRAALALDNAKLFAEAERANRMNDEFLLTLSHELRTPMNVILGWLDVLTSEDVDDESYDSILKTLTRNANAQLQLIDELLDVSSMATGKFVLKIEDRDLTQIATEAIRAVSPSARAREIEIGFTIADGAHFAAVDADRVRQALWNLLANAVKFTPPGGRVDVRIESWVDTVSIFVRDTGQGISADFMPFLFERFRQEDGTLTRAQGGLGVGLSIAYHLVDLHGGTIEAHSEGRGKGSTFTVKLKRSEKVSEPRAPESWISAEI
ncbi:MAG: GAF domain-containing sensor histidine kinase [Bdellovibrionota bacterium]